MMPIDMNNLIVNEIADFKEHIHHYRDTLNSESIWLFLAVIGCWGVPDAQTQKISFGITVVIFFHRMLSKIKDSRSFTRMLKDLEEMIHTELPIGDTQKARLFELQRIKRKNLSAKATFKSSIIFIICFMFLLYSAFTLGYL